MSQASGVGDSPLLLAAITGLFSLFAGGTIVALVRVRADKNRVVVDASQGAVIVQSGVIKSLEGELHRVQAELRDVRIQSTKDLAECKAAINDLKNQVSLLRYPGT